jgi:hypothetical protein
MTNEQRIVLLDHIKNIMTELDTRHACEMGELVSRHQAERRVQENKMSALSAGLNDDAQPALFVVPVVAVKPFPNEQRFFKGGRLNVMKNGKERPKRWRNNSEVEYFYPAAGKVTMKTEVGTPDFESGAFSGRWFTCQERQSIEGKK